MAQAKRAKVENRVSFCTLWQQWTDTVAKPKLMQDGMFYITVTNPRLTAAAAVIVTISDKHDLSTSRQHQGSGILSHRSVLCLLPCAFTHRIHHSVMWKAMRKDNRI
ncbi:hypothetical protein J6590_023525 [Homalodisca vitripennis]|nr:hypothetical protein J6590_023525 [Homalodisca vitripennis]